jgi:ATP synthase protein I
MTRSDEPLPSLDELQEKIDHVRADGKEDVAEPQGKSLGKALNLATEFGAAVGVGGIIGYLLDDALDTSPIFFLGCFLLGFAAGVRSLLRSYKKVM